jgi:beta-glucanase (GH16 family)
MTVLVLKERLHRSVARFRRFLQAAQEQILSAVLVIGFAALIGVIGSLYPGNNPSTPQLPKPKTSFSWLAAPATHSDKQSKTTKVAAKPSCVETATDLPFATCPSFSLDFTSQPDGFINTRAFNIYTGKPEANDEAQLYTDDIQNLQIKDGSLVLKALNNPHNGFQYTSARIDTSGKEDFLYGRIVVRAMLPNSIGTWPAIWMLPTDKKYQAYSPSQNTDLSDGELDIAEAIGTEPNVVYGIAHSLAYPADGEPGYFNKVLVPGNNTAFHDYELDWTPTSLTFKVDNNAYFSIDKQPDATYYSWPYDQHYHLILNLALGGSWGGTDRADFPLDGVDGASLPASMQIKSIRYYPYIAPAQ